MTIPFIYIQLRTRYCWYLNCFFFLFFYLHFLFSICLFHISISWKTGLWCDDMTVTWSCKYHSLFFITHPGKNVPRLILLLFWLQIVLGDRSPQKAFKYTGITCFNTGSFSMDSTFVVYRPCNQEVELSSLWTEYDSFWLSSSNYQHVKHSGFTDKSKAMNGAGNLVLLPFPPASVEVTAILVLCILMTMWKLLV
jgi:hypothetical protein